jgi:hypothetical protein
MALAAAENDEVYPALARHAHDLCLDGAALDMAGRVRQPQRGGEGRQALPTLRLSSLRSTTSRIRL